MIVEGGLQTTIQDFGRVGYQEFGFSPCGALDKKSLAIANILVGNVENEAGIEITLIGPIMKFTKSNIIAITGGNLNPKINGKEVKMYKAVLVEKGDMLSFTNAINGARGYISFAGGLDVDCVMGSKSTNLKCKIGGLEGRELKKNDFIEFTSPKDYLENFASRVINVNDRANKTIILRVILGPQDDAFTSEGLKTFLSSEYEITKEFDRMGCRLEGPEIEHKSSSDIISDGIALGSIQIPATKKPIIMLNDRQTTGGYTKIGTIISVDIQKIAQCKVKDKIKFESVDVETAQNIYRKELEELKKIKDEINRPCIEVLKPRKASRRIEHLLSKI
ncbi:MAG: biotin-dependent carboxyltransferase family protein [Peptostreptococcaceae bacterium]